VAGAVDLDTGKDTIPSWQSRLAAFAELRDTILFGFSALYVLGYVTWAIYSADRGLGVLPPLEGQYFLAGVVPFFLLIAAYALIRVSQPALTASERRRAATWAKWANWAVAIALGLAVASKASLGETVGNVSFAAVNIALYLGLVLRIRSGEVGSTWMRWLYILMVPVLVVAASVLYATHLFPLLPAEFGGPQPTCVALDLAASNLSPQTHAALGAEPADAASAIRSAPLWLHFSGGGVLVVSRQQGRPVPNALRLQDSTVTAFTPAQGCK
jgi:hypothetical protein